MVLCMAYVTDTNGPTAVLYTKCLYLRLLEESSSNITVLHMCGQELPPPTNLG